MSKEDFKKWMNGKRDKAAVMLAATAMALNAAAQSPQKTQPKEKNRQPVENAEKTINLFGAATIGRIEEDGKTYVRFGEEYADMSEFDRKRIKKDFKEETEEAFANAEPDRTDTIPAAEVTRFGAYDYDEKNIVMTYVDFENRSDLAELVRRGKELYPGMSEQEFSARLNDRLDFMKELNDPSSPAYLTSRAHEEQHRTNDKLGIYAPGLSPEQYAVLNQYDECAASVAELNTYTSLYKKRLKEGKSSAEALKIFNKDKSFSFYKQALAAGLDPDSSEGKKLMVEGTLEMWKNNRRDAYQQQTVNFARDMVGRSDMATTIIGDEAELNKRIGKIFDNICDNDYCKEQGVENPGNLSRYLPAEKIELTPQVQREVGRATEERTGMTPEVRNSVRQALNAQKDKDKIRDLIRVASGRKSPQQVGRPISTEKEKRAADNAAVRQVLNDARHHTR